MELFKSRTRVAYTNAVGDKVYPVVVDIKKGIKSTEDIQFVSSDVNTGILSVAFIQGNDNYNVTGADVVCSVMRPDASTLELPCEVVGENIVEVPLGINGTSQDGVYSFDFKVLKGGNKVVGTPIMNYSVSLSIGNDMAVEEDDRLPVLTMLMTQVTELKDETREAINQANVATEASREATANAIESTNNANAVSERVSQETATAISEIKQDTENAIASVNQKTNEAVTRVNDNLTNINNTVATKVAELDTAKSDMTTTVSNKVNEVETRFNTLTSTQQQDAEVIDARDGETSLKARLDRDIEKAKQVYVNVEGSYISTDSSVGYAKDVEILGNTIQSASNLADIRSVGDTVEGQELYEIPVISCGKNLISSNFAPKEIIATTGELTSNDSTTWQSSELIKIEANTNYQFSKYEGVGDGYTYIYRYDLEGKFKGASERFDLGVSNTLINSSYDCLIRIGVRKTGTQKFQLEEGTVATEYEPYQEDKLTILSPVQLEKVGDVRDRIIEKDGVWGVEKNIVTYHASDLMWISCSTHENMIGISTTVPHSMLGNSSWSKKELMCNLLPTKTHQEWNNEVIGIHRHPYNPIVYVNLPKSTYTTTQSAIEYVVTNGMYFKTIQKGKKKKKRRKRRRKGEEEKKKNRKKKKIIKRKIGVKAQVPKSLGATVNTHTEQISNLNKELDRVKKLEESTVSTVTTESDFTTVEATSNGYFEDVKLEGKTLVNLAPNVSIEAVGNGTTVSGNRVGLIRALENNSIYTVMFDVSNDSNCNDAVISFYSNAGQGAGAMYIGDVNTIKGTTYCAKIITNTTYNIEAIGVYAKATATSGTKCKISNIIILEGDHTQNPPNYFEGLKSVGEDTDEIVVSSVYNKRNLIDLKTVNQDWGGGKFETNISSNNLKYHSCEAFDVSFLRNKQIYGGLFRDGVLYRSTMNFVCIFGEDKKQIGDRFGFGNAGYIVPSNAKYMRLMCYSGSDNTLEYINRDKYCISLIPFKDKEPYTPHQSDKKRLLYYNNETQTWEKPILREWDSIEKHSDGKYYYHVRSKEGDYVEGDESLNDCITDLTVSVKKLAQEKVYECTNIDLITYANETNYIVESGAIVPRTTLKVHNNISNVVKILQEKVSLLESNVKASQEVQDMMILETDMRMLDIELALMEFAPMKLNLGGSDMLRSATYFNFLKNHIINETYTKEYLENVMNKYLATGRINQDEYDELYKMLYPPVYDIELPIEP